MDLFLEQLRLRDAKEGSSLSSPSSDEIQLRKALEIQKELVRTLRKQYLSLQDQLVVLTRQKEESAQIIQDKNKNIQTLQDELFTSQLELTHSEEANRKLKIENEDLVARWIERINMEAESHIKPR